MAKTSADVEWFGIQPTNHSKTDQNGCHIEFLRSGLLFECSVSCLVGLVHRHVHADQTLKNGTIQNSTFQTFR